MFNKDQLKYLLDSTDNINYENFYKSDLITMIKILQEKRKNFKYSNSNYYDLILENKELKDENNRLMETIHNLQKWN